MGDEVDASSNAIESWTLSRKVATGFSSIRPADYGSVAYQAVVPRERILSTPKTGLGCLNEFEFVVLGGSESSADKVRVAMRFVKGEFYDK